MAAGRIATGANRDALHQHIRDEHDTAVQYDGDRRGGVVDLLNVEVGLTNLLMLHDPALVWRWSWARFCAYWCRLIRESARQRIEEDERETRQRQDALLAEARAGAGY